jgi:hypothetical protein
MTEDTGRKLCAWLLLFSVLLVTSTWWIFSTADTVVNKARWQTAEWRNCTSKSLVLECHYIRIWGYDRFINTFVYKDMAE